jgi:hypothetical protein
MKNILLEYKDVLNKETYSPEEIAAHHGVSIEQIYSQLELGREMEAEHTTIERYAEEIALDHLLEDPEYYTKLMEMENNE